MESFEAIKYVNNPEDSALLLTNCAKIAMKQYCPSIKTIEDLEDNVSLPIMYKILEIAGGITINKPNDQQPENIKENVSNSSSSWDELDLAKLEAEVFLLGIWKDYEELEKSLSMPELLATLEIKRELDYTEKKFLAAMQGVDLDKDTSQDNAWDRLKAKVASGGKATSTNDILAYQGVEAQKAGFGIGMGLDYEKA